MVHLKNTRNNNPGRLSTSEGGQARNTQATPMPSSEGGQATPNPTKANMDKATSEGEDGDIQSNWYNNEREKITQSGKPMKKRLRRSPRFTKEQHERLDNIENMTTTIRGVEKDREENEVRTIYGLGVQKKPILNKNSIIIEEEEEDEEYIAPQSSNIRSPKDQDRSVQDSSHKRH